MRRKVEEATVWIGYADFLTTLAILFFVLLVLRIGVSKPAVLLGAVRDSDGAAAVRDCIVSVGGADSAVTDSRGQFSVTIDSLARSVQLGLIVRCAGYDPHRSLVSVAPGDTSSLTAVRVARAQTLTVETLPGDALFDWNKFELTAQGSATVIELGQRLKNALAPEEVISVQGHTDDLEFPAAAGKDNWVLSSERAIAAARVLVGREVGISRCQVTIMGFGPSRPVDRILPTDSKEQRASRRKNNRRIEFVRLHGTDLTRGSCAS